MENIITALMSNGAFSLVDLILIAVVGVQFYFLGVKKNNATKYVDEAVAGLKAELDVSHANVNKLSAVVEKVRCALEEEREAKWVLKNEILTLKSENERLRRTVEDLTRLVDVLKEENEKLLNQLKEVNDR